MKCATCNAPLEEGNCAFLPSAEAQVIGAIKGSNASALKDLPMGNMAEAHMEVALSFCDKCRNVGQLSVGVFGESQKWLIEKQLLQGPFVGALADEVMKRQSDHEERYESS